MNAELRDFEFLQHFIHNFEAFDLGQHRIALTSYVEILQQFPFLRKWAGNSRTDRIPCTCPVWWPSVRVWTPSRFETASSSSDRALSGSVQRVPDNCSLLFPDKWIMEAYRQVISEGEQLIALVLQVKHDVGGLVAVLAHQRLPQLESGRVQSHSTVLHKYLSDRLQYFLAQDRRIRVVVSSACNIWPSSKSTHFQTCWGRFPPQISSLYGVWMYSSQHLQLLFLQLIMGRKMRISLPLSKSQH